MSVDPKLRISLIVAMGTGRVIGDKGKLPWRLPADLARFKRLTMGHPIVMGRKTWESIGRPLPGRRNLVLSRSGISAEGVESFISVDEVLAACMEGPGGKTSEATNGDPNEEIFVIGGGEIYTLFLPFAYRIHLTEVEGDFHGDAHFPPLEPGEWREVSRETRPSDAQNPHICHFLVLERSGTTGSDLA